ncbi:MAG: hypothetical protein HYV97_19125 [Bdellovibrio sp.]|nr:hypothetical protein [Bdellovibrio sp.]
MEILTEEEISETEKTPADDDIAAASYINGTASTENKKETNHQTGA